MAGLSPQVKRQVESVVAQLCVRDANQRNLSFRKPIEAINGAPTGGDFKVNRHEVLVDARKFLSLPADGMVAFSARIVDAETEFKRIQYQEKAQEITRTRARILRDLAYLRRSLPSEDYDSTIATLLAKAKGD